MHRLLFLLALVLVLVLTSAPVLAGSPVVHTVAWGETLYSIARTYGITPQALAQANGMNVNGWVYAGDSLKIPVQSAAPLATTTTPSGYYAVRAGDSLSGVAERFGVGVSALARANNLPIDGLLYVGWSLKIPTTATSAPAARPVAAQTYIVQAGEYLAQIALRYGITAQAIAQANNLPNQWLIYAGQRLTIPVQANGAGASAPASNAAAPAAPTDYRVSGIPLYRQQQTLTCEEASAAMATRGAVSEARITASIPRSENPFSGIRGRTSSAYLGGLDDYGTYAQGLARGLNALGVKSIVLYGQPYADFKTSILTHLQAGHPVIWWNTWHETYQNPVYVKTSDGVTVKLVPYEHAGVIVAANDRGITYNDPYDATVRFVAWADHQRISAYFDNMALVVP